MSSDRAAGEIRPDVARLGHEDRAHQHPRRMFEPHEHPETQQHAAVHARQQRATGKHERSLGVARVGHAQQRNHQHECERSRHGARNADIGRKHRAARDSQQAQQRGDGARGGAGRQSGAAQKRRDFAGDQHRKHRGESEQYHARRKPPRGGLRIHARVEPHHTEHEGDEQRASDESLPEHVTPRS